MHDDHHIADALRCRQTTDQAKSRSAKTLLVKMFYLTIIVAGIYVSIQPTDGTTFVRFMSACQNLKKRGGEGCVREMSTKNGANERDTPPDMLAKAE